MNPAIQLSIDALRKSVPTIPDHTLNEWLSGATEDSTLVVVHSFDKRRKLVRLWGRCVKPTDLTDQVKASYTKLKDLLELPEFHGGSIQEACAILKVTDHVIDGIDPLVITALDPTDPYVYYTVVQPTVWGGTTRYKVKTHMF